MVKQRLARLDRAMAKLGARSCSRCGGRDGVGGVPLVVMCGEPWYGTYAPPDGRCPQCGAIPSHVVRIVTPLYAEGQEEANRSVTQ